MKVTSIFRIGVVLVLGFWAFTGCTALFPLKTTTPEDDSTSATLGSISGAIRSPYEPCETLRVFAHEVDTGQVTSIQTQEGECTYTIPDLPAGNYLVVGWYHPTGVSGAYTSLDTVMAVGAEEAQACEEAIVTIVLKPGEAFSGADIGCWGGDFFDIAQPHGFTHLDPNRWKLTELDSQALIPGTAITLFFEAGKFYGSAGCNNYSGKYATAPGGGFSLSEIEKNVMLCIEPAGVMEQEDQYLTALISTSSYETVNEVLELVDQDGKTVLKFDLMPRFVDVAPEDLVGKTWRLVLTPWLSGVDFSQFTINFDGQSFSGTTTCRDYAGTYTATVDRLHIDYLEMTTDVNCEEDLLTAEGEYTTLLEAVEQYNVLEDQLELYTLKGEKMVFELAGE
jgi:heat shock protein HslJ